MRKIILLFGFLFCSSVLAQSNWIYVGDSTNDHKIFIDRNSIQRSGDSVTYWEKVNYPVRDTLGNLSTKTQWTINCRTREEILRYIIAYDDLDNNGKVTTSGDPKESWRPISPDSVGEQSYLFVCKRG